MNPSRRVSDGAETPPVGLRLAPHLIIVSVGYVTFGYAAVPSLVVARFDVTLVSVGLLMSAILLAFGVVQIPAGRYLDGTGTTRPLLAGTAVHAVLAVALDLVGSFAALLALRFVWGLVGGALLAGGATHVARLYSERAATRTQGLYGGMLTVGGAASFLAVPVVTAHTGWFGVHATGAVLAVPAVAALGVHAAGPPDERTTPQRPTDADDATDVSHLRALVNAPTVALAGVCYVAVLSSYITLSTFVTAYFRDLGVLASLNAAVLALASLGRAAGGVGVERLAVDDARTIAIAVAAGGAGFLALAVADRPLLVAALPMATMVAVSVPFGAIYGVAGSTEVGEGTGLGAVLAAGNFAALVFPAVTGLVREATGTYAAAFVLLAALNFVAVAAALRLRSG